MCSLGACSEPFLDFELKRTFNEVHDYAVSESEACIAFQNAVSCIFQLWTH